jgi:hypothetical protein
VVWQSARVSGSDGTDSDGTDLLFGRGPGKVPAVGGVALAAEVTLGAVDVSRRGRYNDETYWTKLGSGSYAGAALKTPMPLEVR